MNRNTENEHVTASSPFNLDGSVPDFVESVIDFKASVGSIERSTEIAYRNELKKIRRSLSDIPARDLTREQAQNWVLSTSRSDSGKPTSRRTINLVKSCYQMAVDRALLDLNPFNGVVRPKPSQKRPINNLSPHETARVLKLLDNETNWRFRTAVKLALFSGLREGEVCGLQWRDLKLSLNQLSIVRSVARANGETFVKSPKSNRTRIIPLNESLLEALREAQEDMVSELSRSGIPFSGELYIVGKPDGTFYHPHTLWKNWTQFVKKHDVYGTAGLRPVFHDLRHTFATTWISNGGDIKALQEILGHTSAMVTLDLYASATLESKAQGMRKISSYYTQLLSLDGEESDTEHAKQALRAMQGDFIFSSSDTPAEPDGTEHDEP